MLDLDRSRMHTQLMIAKPMSTREVAAQLGVSVRTVHRAIASGRLTPAGQLPGYRGAYYFDPTHIDSLTHPSTEKPKG